MSARFFKKLFSFFVLGTIFEQGSEEIQSAFKFAILTHNQNVSGRRFELQAFVDVINTADAFKLSRLSEYLYPSTRYLVALNALLKRSYE